MAMQGSELKAIREALGWGQRRFAEEIGMTQTYISQMESGKKPIERRTELAARHLADPVIRVTIACLGEGYHLTYTKPGRRGRVHIIDPTAYSDLDEAIDAAEQFSKEEGCPYIPTDVDYERLYQRKFGQIRK